MDNLLLNPLPPPGHNPYQLLRAYSYYHTLLGSLLILLFQNKVAPNVLGVEDPALFFYTACTYTLLNFVSMVYLWRAKDMPSPAFIFGVLLIDLIAINLMMHASGGVTNGLGYLTLITVAAGGILLTGELALSFAALACIAVISESLYRFFYDTLNHDSLFSAASLGVLIFIIAIVFQHLTRKLLASAEEARSQAIQAAHIQKLAQLILERMRTGILVFNRHNEIELCNQSAMNLLSFRPPIAGKGDLKDIPALEEKVKLWQQSPKAHSPVLKINSGLSDEVKINFAALEPGDEAETLVFVEDNRSITQQAQQLKLASLGRLTASIAHEIRNPLGAISHASQLLGESEALPPGDQRLLEIIDAQCKRVNQIIENVLQLSRRRTAQPRQVMLNTWLKDFVADYRRSKNEPLDIVLHCLAPGITGQFDPGQLQQVLTNLCDNGLRYSLSATGKAHIMLVAGVDSKLQRPFINVVDDGPGISEENEKHLFEPFFTTENAGSGLGLYLSKELCEANQAFIQFRRTPDGSSCFHIQLAHAERAL